MNFKDKNIPLDLLFLDWFLAFACARLRVHKSTIFALARDARSTAARAETFLLAQKRPTLGTDPVLNLLTREDWA